jgi:hypothetical protein
MKPIRVTLHARSRLAERGTTAAEVEQAIRTGRREVVREGRFRCRLNLQYRANWQGKYYDVKQVAPVIMESATEIVVITVYSFFF